MGKIAGPVLVNLWASWCGPCRDETPLLRRALTARRDSGRSVPAVLGVDTNDDPASARAFLGAEQVSWPIVTDPQARLATALRVSGLPVTLGLDADGRQVYRHIGVLTAAEVERAIRTVTAGSRSTATTTGAGT